MAAKKTKSKAFYSVTIVGPDHKVTQITMVSQLNTKRKDNHWIVSGTENGVAAWRHEFQNPKTAGCLFTDKIDDFLRKHVHR